MIGAEIGFLNGEGAAIERLLCGGIEHGRIECVSHASLLACFRPQLRAGPPCDCAQPLVERPHAPLALLWLKPENPRQISSIAPVGENGERRLEASREAD